MAKPDNALKYPISRLIEELQKLPPDTTFDAADGEASDFYGGQCENNGKKLGTSYMMRINICEGYVE